MIEDPVQNLGSRLLGCEPTDAQLAERYRKEISAMLFRGPGIRPRMQIACGLVIILIAVAAAIIALCAEEEVVRFVVFPGAVYMCFAGTVAVVCAIRRVDARRYRRMWFVTGMSWIVTLATGCLLGAWQVEDARLRWQLTEAAFVLLGFLGVGAVVEAMENLHKRTELKLVDLEYRIADLAAKIRRS